MDEQQTTIVRLRRLKITHKYPHLHPFILTQQCRRRLPVYRSRHLQPRLLRGAKDRSTTATYTQGTYQTVSAVKFSPPHFVWCVFLLFAYAWVSYMWSCSHLVICFATRAAADNVVKIWSPFTGESIRNLSGHTRHLMVERWDIPCFCIGRYEYTNMEPRNCMFIPTTHILLMEMMGGPIRA